MSLNIWVINQFAGTNRSGWGERHFYFSKYWVKKGHNVSIISGGYNHMFREVRDTPKQFNIEDVEGTRFCWVKVPKYNPKSFVRFWSFIVFAFKSYFAPQKSLGKPDIIIVSSMPIFPILTGHLLKKKYKAKKLIFEIRDLWPLTLIHLGQKSEKHPAVKFIGWFEKFGYKVADHIVSLLPFAAEHFEEVAEAGNKFVYIPNGLDEKVIEEEALKKSITDSIPKDKFVIGYTGTIGLANALEYFVEAAGLLQNDPRFHFVVVGDGYLKDELMSMSADFGNITFVDKIRKNQVASILGFFDVCFVGRNNSPLFKHGVSANKYFDYMLASKPVLDSNNLIKDPVEMSGCGIIVKPESAEAIRDGVIKLFESGDEKLKEMGQKGYYYVKKHHNIEYLSGEYIQLFNG
ncbi:MAG: glycosyltransferase WbuB [Balneolaceae bacterium]|nr:MAG: glycosyltransferase WbuB [Balneolaceae bacterium]